MIVVGCRAIDDLVVPLRDEVGVLVAAVVDVVAEVVVDAAAVMLERCSASESFERRHSLLVGNRKGRPDDLAAVGRLNVYVHLFERCRLRPLVILPALTLGLSTSPWRHRKLCLQLLRFVRDGHFFRDLVHDQFPFLADAWVAVLGGEVLLDHLDDFPELLHGQGVVAEDGVFTCHFELIEKVRLHFA